MAYAKTKNSKTVITNFKRYNTASIYLEEGWYKVSELKKLIDSTDKTSKIINKHYKEMLGIK